MASPSSAFIWHPARGYLHITAQLRRTVSNLVRVRGFEPPTNGLKVRCSTNWATRALWLGRKESNLCISGQSRAHWPLCYAPIIWWFYLTTSAKPCQENCFSKRKSGAGDRIWTCNRLITNQMRYRLRHASILWCARLDLNQWLSAYEAGVLTNWTTGTLLLSWRSLL